MSTRLGNWSGLRTIRVQTNTQGILRRKPVPRNMKLNETLPFIRTTVLIIALQLHWSVFRA